MRNINLLLNKDIRLQLTPNDVRSCWAPTISNTTTAMRKT